MNVIELGRNRSGVWALLILVVALIDGCGIREETQGQAGPTETAAAATETPTAAGATTTDPPRGPEESTPLFPTVDPSQPFHLGIECDLGERLTADQVVESFDFVVLGQVIEDLPARWTTPDGQRPADPFDSSVVPSRVTIATPHVVQLEVPKALNSLTGPVISLDTEETPLVPPGTDRVVVATHGGTVGQDSIFDTCPATHLEAGEQVILGVRKALGYGLRDDVDQRVPTESGDAWWVGMKYVLRPDGTAEDYQGPRPADEVIREILAAVARNSQITLGP